MVFEYFSIHLLEYFLFLTMNYCCRVLLLLAVLTSVALAARSQVVINEVFIHPPSVFDDQSTEVNSIFVAPPCNTGTDSLQFQAREWIELYNKSYCDTVNLSGWIIGSNLGYSAGFKLCTKQDMSDHLGVNRGFFIFPDGTFIPPLSFLKIGGKQSEGPTDLPFNGYEEITDGVHPNFQGSARYFLNSSKGWLGLWQPDGELYESIFWTTLDRDEISDTTYEQYFNRDTVRHPYLDSEVIIPSASELLEQGKLDFAGNVLLFDEAQLRYVRTRGFAREPDGGCWERLAASTPKACNADCIEPPEPPFITTAPEREAICSGEPIVLSAREGGAHECVEPWQYVWNGSLIEEELFSRSISDTLEQTTSYWLKITVGPCEWSDTLTLAPAEDLFRQVEIVADTAGLCAGEPLRVTYAAGEIVGAQYNWIVENASVTDSAEGFIEIVLPEGGPAAVILESRIGECMSADTLALNVPPLPLSYWDALDRSVCQNDTLTIAFSGDSPEGLSPELFSGAAELSDFDSTGAMRLVFANPGTYSAQISILNRSCAYSESFEINVWPKVSADLEVATENFCSGDTITVSVEYTTDSLTRLSWSFDRPDYVDETQSLAEADEAYWLVWNTPGKRSVSAAIDNPENRPCIIQPQPLEINISVAPEIVLSGAPPVICAAETLTITAAVAPDTATLSYTSQDVSVTEVGDSLHFVFPYNELKRDSIVFYAENGDCKDSTAVSFVVIPEKTASIWVLEDTVCLGDTFTVKALPTDARMRASLVESEAEIVERRLLDDTLVFEAYPTSPGRFNFRISFEYGGAVMCVRQPPPLRLVAVAPPAAAFNVTLDKDACRIPVPARIAFSADTAGIARYYWDFDGAIAEPVPGEREQYWTHWPENGIYEISLSVEDALCRSEAVLEAFTYDQANAVNALFGIPNVFTPNNDGKNDCFRIETRNPDCIALSCNIFDRWGRRVATLENAGDCWTGDANGGPCPESAYFYLLEYRGSNDRESRTIQGMVTLLR